MKRFAPFALAVTLAAAVYACRGSLPSPPVAPQPTSAYEEVPSLPPPGRVEIVPERPEGGAVWVDGQWLGVQRGRWVWQTGGWVNAPAGATFSPWTTTRRDDGRIFFAAPAWRAKDGGAVEAPPFVAKAQHGDPSAVVSTADEEAPRPTPSGSSGPRRDNERPPLPAPLITDAGPPIPPSLDPDVPLPPGGPADGGRR